MQKTCQYCYWWQRDKNKGEWEPCINEKLPQMIGPAPWPQMYGLWTHYTFGCVHWRRKTKD